MKFSSPKLSHSETTKSIKIKLAMFVQLFIIVNNGYDKRCG